MDESKKHMTVHDLMRLPANEREKILEQIFMNIPENEDWDICEAYEIYDYDEENE